jgi:pectinesterase
MIGLVLVTHAETPNANVALDGSGQYKSIQEAISEAPLTHQNGVRWVIHVKPGIYHERVYVQRERGNILLVGDDAEKTVIEFNLSAKQPGPDGKPIGTFRTPTFQIDGDGFEAQRITFSNTAGPVGQAVAMRVDGDRVVFRQCRFLGRQDTLLVNRGRQYFSQCYIEGDVDYIFGGATAYFDHCELHCVAAGYITAASTPQDQANGFVFADCRVTGNPEVRTYLGRPWRDYAKTIYIRTEMSDVVRAEGWNDWKKPETHHTATYGEFESTGPGGSSAQRVEWKHELISGAAAAYTPLAVLGGTDNWEPDPRPTLHFAGDSTMADKTDIDFPERGWGQLFREYVEPSWQFVNYAVNGRSTKSFRDLGHWALLMRQVHAGDWVLIEFGHNDEKKTDPARYADPEKAYPENLRAYIREVRMKGANPILATPIARRDWDGATLKDTHGAYLTAVREVAASEHVPLLDLEAETRKMILQLGPEGSIPLFMIFPAGAIPQLPQGRTDNTHLRESGARRVAEIAVRDLKEIAPALKDVLSDRPIAQRVGL